MALNSPPFLHLQLELKFFFFFFNLLGLCYVVGDSCKVNQPCFGVAREVDGKQKGELYCFC